MKKLIAAIIIFLFTATVTGYAGIYKKNEKSNGQYGSLYERGDSSEDSGFGALYRAPSKVPEERPGNGGGIGQRTPISDGLPVLIACCAALLVIKHSIKKQRK